MLRIITDNPHAAYQEIANAINKTPKTVQRTLARLKEHGLIVRIGPAKTGHWAVRDSF